MDPKAPRPPLTPEELIAVRDGELSERDIGDVLDGDFAAQRQLLEARLLSLALSLAGGTRQVHKLTDELFEESASVDKTSGSIVDTDRLVQYVSGEMTPDSALAFERTLRGDPRAFARLVEVKDAFFGQARALSKIQPRPMPSVVRQTIGILVVQIVGESTQLSIERQRSRIQGLNPPSSAPFRRDQQRMRDREREREDEEFAALVARVSSLKEVIAGLTSHLQSLTEVKRTDRNVEFGRYIAEISANLRGYAIALSELTRQLNELAMMISNRPPAESKLMDMGEPYRRSTAKLVAAGVRLEFEAGYRGPGELAVTLHPSSESTGLATFTWVVPGVTFEDLQPGPKRHELGRAREGSLLLIDRGFGGTQAIEVEVREIDEDFF
jgi:hypothetical protein